MDNNNNNSEVKQCTYILKIDNREKELIKNLTLNHVLENLDIGDIQFIDEETNNIIVIIERKTYSDLSASIVDGRYKEQKMRLIHSVNNKVRKIILIEGHNINNFNLDLKIYNSVIVNTLIRDNIHIYHTENILSTVQFIETIYNNLPKYYEELKDEIINDKSPEFNTQCSAVKKNNMSPEICFRNMLCQIPQVSNSIANILVSKYDNMNNFITQLNIESETDKEKIMTSLSNEKHGTNNKKIGDKIALKIVQNIFNCEIEIKKKEPKKRTKKESKINNDTIDSKKDNNKEVLENDKINIIEKNVSLFSD